MGAGWRVVTAAAALAGSCSAALGQQQHERLAVRLAVTPAAEGGHGTVLVRVWNIGSEDVNMPPMRFACSSDAAPPHGVPLGARVVLSIFVDTGTLRKANVPLSATDCRPVDEGKGAAWRHLLPGQYTELEAHVKAGILSVPGAKYTVQATYLGPQLSGEEKMTLRYEGLIVPKGSYSSNAVSYEVAKDGASVDVRP